MAKIEATHCPNCSMPSDDIEARRMNTQYADDSQNIFVSCEACYKDYWDYWEDMWAEYYAGQGHAYTPEYMSGQRDSNLSKESGENDTSIEC